jgi:hypothetical protein
MEKWRTIEDFAGLYEVSDMGNVRSLSRKTLGRWGSMKTTPGRLLNPGKHPTGYIRVALSKQGKSQNKSVHRLVAEAFIPNPDNKPCVNHKDSNRANNKAENLEWCTHFENSKHANDLGRLGAPRLEVCKNGHQRTPENITKKRSCKSCDLEWQRNYMKNKQLEALTRLELGDSNG